MSSITTQSRMTLIRLLRQKMNIERFMKRRTVEVLAAEMDVSTVTIRASLRRDRASGKLSPEQLEYVSLMLGEREKHRQEASDHWTIEAIANRSGVSRWTAQRYYERERFSRRP